MKKRALGGLLMAFALTSACCAADQSLGVKEGRLAPCPDSPNCVSTQSEIKGHSMKPLPFANTRQESRQRILTILKNMKRVNIVAVTDSYIHAEFKSALFRFVDDVEFYLDETTRVVHFRSASRVGTYDFGVNRKRMKKFSEKYLKAVRK